VAAVVLVVGFGAVTPAIVLMVAGLVLTVIGAPWDGSGPVTGG